MQRNLITHIAYYIIKFLKLKNSREKFNMQYSIEPKKQLSAIPPNHRYDQFQIPSIQKIVCYSHRQTSYGILLDNYGKYRSLFTKFKCPSLSHSSPTRAFNHLKMKVQKQYYDTEESGVSTDRRYYFNWVQTRRIYSNLLDIKQLMHLPSVQKSRITVENSTHGKEKYSVSMLCVIGSIHGTDFIAEKRIK